MKMMAFEVKPIVAAVALGGLLYIVGQYVASQPQRIERETEAKREITVQGAGEAHAQPDVARVTLGVQTGRQATAEVALSQLSQKFNQVVTAVKDLGIKADDIKTTNFTIAPSYDYTNGQQLIRGYEASESIEVKVRKLDQVGEVLARATAQGVNQAGNISFDLDQPEKLQLEAQRAAIKNARDSAEELARALGVGLGRVKTFSATPTETQPPLYAQAKLEAAGQGGDLAAPPIPIGTHDLTTTVTITYELR